jgi:hypothetical protein
VHHAHFGVVSKNRRNREAMSPATYAAPVTGPTGPRTEEGKKKSALNALRHGLTGRVVVMPWEDMDAYMRFCAELMTDLAPETSIERQYAQTFCDTQWRLNRMRSIEDSILALGHSEAAGRIETEHPQVHAALTSARVFYDDSKTFVNLSLYEQRLQRSLEKSLKQLQVLQAERRAQTQAETQAKAKAEVAAQPAAVRQREPVAEAQAESPATEEFVFSTPEIDRATRLRAEATDADSAQSCDPQSHDVPQFTPGLAA